MAKVTRIPALPFLVETGLLFEINRTVLHPLGLALEVQTFGDGSMMIGGLWDYRHDPEGMLYDPETFRRGQEKFKQFMAEFGTKKLDERLHALGFVIQERPDQ